MSTPPLIDPVAIQNLRALSPGDHDEFLRELIGIFLVDTPERLAELDEARRLQDSHKFVRAAHSIKGSASNLGAAALGAVAERLEQQSREGPLEPLVPLLAELQETFDQTRRELEQLLK